MSSVAAHHLSARPAVARRATLSRRTAGDRAPVRTRVRSPAVAAADTENLPANLKKIVSAFQMVPDAMQRYKQLLFFAAKLKGFDEADRVDDNKVPGCVSQVWVVPRIEDGLVYFTADSDSQLTKGLAALLVEGLSGSTPKEIGGGTQLRGAPGPGPEPHTEPHQRVHEHAQAHAEEDPEAYMAG